MSDESRYEKAPQKLERLVNNMKDKRFPSLRDARIVCVLDEKPKKSKGKYRLAEIRKADDFIKFFASLSNEIMSEINYVMVFDKKLHDTIDKKDKMRLIFHELNHAYRDENDKFVLLPHDFEGFYSEIDYNKDDPEWAWRLANEMEILHEDK